MNIARQQGVGFTLWKLLCLAGFLFLAVVDVKATKVIYPYNKCIANLKVLDGATQQWALDNQLGQTNVYSLTDPNLLAYLPDKQLPVCPRGGTYLAGANVEGHLTCSLHGTPETAERKDVAITIAVAKKKVMLPVIAMLVGLLLTSPWARISPSVRSWLPLPVTLVYLVVFAPYHFGMLEVGRPYAVANGVLIFGTLIGGLVLSLAGLKSKERAVRLFMIVTSAYCGLFLISAFMHLR
ncbi:MAG: hypothetical protein K0Q55_63 [Verrucomicrobia bacterium]|nr:hypothetical protein [Verrucomicrobiota bacterium]